MDNLLCNNIGLVWHTQLTVPAPCFPEFWTDHDCHTSIIWCLGTGKFPSWRQVLCAVKRKKWKCVLHLGFHVFSCCVANHFAHFFFRSRS